MGTLKCTGIKLKVLYIIDFKWLKMAHINNIDLKKDLPFLTRPL